MAKKIKNKFDYMELMGADKDELASFTLLDKKTMERLMIDGKVDVPKKKVDIPKDEQWNMKTLGSKLLLGIQNGDSIPKIADSFQEVIGNNRASAIRNARTMTTSAECHGRMDSYESLAKQGVVQKKHWIATGDNRTRDTHLELDGQERDINEAFSNGLMFPGDANGEPSEVWNCFPGETSVAIDCDVINSYKRWYDGDLIKIKTASGVEFSCTPNHPILSEFGWVRAAVLNNGDNLVVTFAGDNPAFVPRRNPNIKHIFTRMDTFHKFFYMVFGERTRNLSMNFHGDIATSNVEVVSKKRFLRSYFNSSRFDGFNKFLLKLSDSLAFGLCHFCKSFFRVFVSSFSILCSRCKSFPFFWRSLRHAKTHSIRSIASGDSVLAKVANDNRSADFEFFCKSLDRLSGVVFLDKISDIQINSFHGFVYNLQTDNNYYFVNNIISKNGEKNNGIYAIAHNCRCSIATKIVGFRKADGSIAKVADVNEPESAHEKQIREEKEKRGIAEEGRKEPESTHEKRIQEERERSKAEEGRKTSAPAEKILDSLIDSYEYHRQHNNTRALPAEKITGDFFKIQFTKMDDELKDAIADQFESLSSRYDTTVVEIRPMDAMEYTGKKNAFATTFHDYTVDTSTIMYNPVKITDLDRANELIDSGFWAKIDKNLANRYVITHEFAHTLVDMGSRLNNKTNWLDADYDKIKSARKEINKVYDRYMADVGNLDNQKKAAELEAMTTMDQNAWNKAAELGKELSSKFVSRYSLVNSDEFMAECFAHHELGGAQNDYVDEIMEIIERYFGREEE